MFDGGKRTKFLLMAHVCGHVYCFRGRINEAEVVPKAALRRVTYLVAAKASLNVCQRHPTPVLANIIRCRRRSDEGHR